MPVFLAKKELSKNKKISGFLNILSTFYIDCENPRVAFKIINDIKDHAKANKKHIIIFPEGTRSKDSKMKPFKSGVFRIAKKAFLSIVPITINYAMYAVNFSHLKKITIQVIFHSQVKPLSIISMHHSGIANKIRIIIADDLKIQSENFANKEQQIT